MKLIKNLGIVLMLVMAVSSCKKSDSPSGPVVPGSVTGYPKSFVISQPGQSTSFTFTYDGSNRVTQIKETNIDSSSPSSNDSLIENYTYTGSSSWPSSASGTFLISSISLPFTDDYTYNSQNKVIKDTVILGGAYASNAEAVSYFTYPSGQTNMAYQLTSNIEDSQFVYLDTLRFTGQNITYFSQTSYTVATDSTPTSTTNYTETLTTTNFLNPLANLNAFALFIYNPTIFDNVPTILDVDLPLTKNETKNGNTLNAYSYAYSFDTKGRVLQVIATQTSDSGNSGYTETFSY
jgi:hypothetical protein